NVDLTVELNREQRGQGATFISHISHHVQPPPSTTTATSRITAVGAQSSTGPESRQESCLPLPSIATVDIPFDESPAAYQPKKEEKRPHCDGDYGHTSGAERPGDSRFTCSVTSEIVVISINGEELKDKYPSAINRMLHEAARLGEAEVCIERKDGMLDSVSIGPGRFHLCTSFPGTPTRSAAVSPSRSYLESRTSTRSEYRTSSGPSSDYKVTSMHEKTGPGKLTDFVPESERADGTGQRQERRRKEFSYRRASDEEPRLIRNYDLPPATPTTTRVTPIPVTSAKALNGGGAWYACYKWLNLRFNEASQFQRATMRSFEAQRNGKVRDQ
ncbi:hypothetical protein OSTOST_18411, partial [Ostertagia ostertagi]